MPRPKTKGEAICIRLEQHVDVVFQALSASRGVTARDLAATVLSEWIATQSRTPGAAQAVPRQSQAVANDLVKEFFQ